MDFSCKLRTRGEIVVCQGCFATSHYCEHFCAISESPFRMKNRASVAKLPGLRPMKVSVVEDNDTYYSLFFNFINKFFLII
jgi:hypothetical protein